MPEHLATAVIIIAIVVICVFAVKKYIKTLRQGCCGSGGDIEKRLSANADTSECKFRYTVKVSGMKCENCAIRIDNNFYRQKIISQSSHKTGITEVFSEKPVSDFSLRQTITGLGYSIERIDYIEL